MMVRRVLEATAMPRGDLASVLGLALPAGTPSELALLGLEIAA